MGLNILHNLFLGYSLSRLFSFTNVSTLKKGKPFFFHHIRIQISLQPIQHVVFLNTIT